ncbi:MAG TPA: dephospho-CoA kinase [Planctomycetota bacterium]|nr:dephospho-CoA kinase [Planctomycetota bacterium]
MIVGLLGGVGAGKSTVRRMLEDLGAKTVDADALAHDALESREVRSLLAGWLGSGYIGADGKVDRKAVASVVFASREKLVELESCVHPLVLSEIEKKVKDFEQTSTKGVLVLDVPLLLSSPLASRCDALVFVEAGLGLRRSRVAARGWSDDELERREQLQPALEAKRSAAHHVIDNTGTLEWTRQQVARLYEGWMKDPAA